MLRPSVHPTQTPRASPPAAQPVRSQPSQDAPSSSSQGYSSQNGAKPPASTAPALSATLQAPAKNAGHVAAPAPERRISTLNEAQIMEKLRSVVSKNDPSLVYAKIKKIGQGCVAWCCQRVLIAGS
jgi:hypothetical protein